mgnify:FL=1|nr:LysR family transcriptional regulator [uncultured Blautia sp.]
MNWNQLEYVLQIMKEKSITRAAQKLYISQPSLSLSLKSLEQELGTELFQRKNGELISTYGGKLFCDWAASALQSRQQMADKLADISRDRRHFIKIGLSPHRSAIMLPDILEKFYCQAQNCDVQIAEEPTYILRELLEEGELDFIVDVPHPDVLNYESEILAEEKILLAMSEKLADQIPKDHIGVCRSSSRETKDDQEFCIRLSQKLDIPFILLTDKQVLGKMSRRILQDCGICPSATITCFNVETALALVGRGLGASFVPDIFQKQKKNVTGIQYYSIEKYQETRKICLIYRKNQYQNNDLKLIQEIFRKHISEKYGKK